MNQDEAIVFLLGAFMIIAAFPRLVRVVWGIFAIFMALLDWYLRVHS